MKRVTRRELGQLAAGLAAARGWPASAQPPAQKYIGPLTGVARLDDRGFDPVVSARNLYAQAARKLRFQATSKAEAERWQQELRTKLTELVGGFPEQRVALRPAPLETR